MPQRARCHYELMALLDAIDTHKDRIVTSQSVDRKFKVMDLRGIMKKIHNDEYVSRVMSMSADLNYWTWTGKGRTYYLKHRDEWIGEKAELCG